MLALALEQGVRQHGHHAVAVAGRAAVLARLALPCHANLHAVVDAGGDVDLGFDLLERVPGAAACAAGAGDARSLTLARGAGGLHADDAGLLDHLAAATAVRASLAFAARGGASAF